MTTPLRPLTSHQQHALTVLRDYITEHGHPPTRAELADLLGVSSTSTAQAYIVRLAAKGYIRVIPGAHRVITILDEQGQAA